MTRKREEDCTKQIRANREESAASPTSSGGEGKKKKGVRENIKLNNEGERLHLTATIPLGNRADESTEN